MSEHDARILAPKSRPVTNALTLLAFRDSHPFCQACGAGEYGTHVLTNHHIIGGRGGRSDEDCNLLRLGWEPCHMLAEGLDVRDECAKWSPEFRVDGTRFPGPYLPKITLGIALSMKIRAGELKGPTSCPQCGNFASHREWCGTCKGTGFLTLAEWDRLTVLHGRNLPDLEPIPAFFVDLYRRNRPELNT